MTLNVDMGNAPKNTHAVFDYLKKMAELMRTASYGQIAKAIGAQEDRKLANQAMRYPLGFLRDQVCRPNGLPWLNALAVSGKTGVPGDSFLPEGVAFGSDDRVLWRGAVLAVYGYPWETIALPAVGDHEPMSGGEHRWHGTPDKGFG